MTNFVCNFRLLPWFVAAVLSFLAAACGGGGQSPIFGAGSISPVVAPTVTVVTTYLGESAGIAAHKIKAKGVNGSEPITKPGDCVGTKATKELIACLQPDRRVDIEVSGKR
jgi:hypothetical protein